MKKVAIVSNDKFKNKIDEDINLQKELEINGIEADIISWKDITVDYSKYNCLILRSAWGYQNDYENFIRWLNFLKQFNISIFNSVDIIKNNIRKDMQFEILDKNNIHHIPTIFVKENLDIRLLNKDNVVKPIISGSGERTFKGDEVNLLSINQVMNEKDNGLMIQPYIEEVKDGEYSIIYIDKENTHNMIRTPGVFTQKKKPFQVFDVPKKVLDLSNSVRDIKEYKDALYMRVDIVNTKEPMVMEVELTEPDLLTRNIESKEPIKKLTKAIQRRI